MTVKHCHEYSVILWIFTNKMIEGQFTNMYFHSNNCSKKPLLLFIILLLNLGVLARMAFQKTFVAVQKSRSLFIPAMPQEKHTNKQYNKYKF